jgi:hypothetical protein
MVACNPFQSDESKQQNSFWIQIFLFVWKWRFPYGNPDLPWSSSFGFRQTGARDAYGKFPLHFLFEYSLNKQNKQKTNMPKLPKTKQAEAKERLDNRRKQTARQQIAKLDLKNEPAKRERARLLSVIATQEDKAKKVWNSYCFWEFG